MEARWLSRVSAAPVISTLSAFATTTSAAIRFDFQDPGAIPGLDPPHPLHPVVQIPKTQLVLEVAVAMHKTADALTTRLSNRAAIVIMVDRQHSFSDGRHLFPGLPERFRLSPAGL